MLIRPELRAIPFSPVPDEGLKEVQSRLQNGGTVVRATYRIAGSPRPFEPKIDFLIDNGGERRTIPVTFGPRTLALLEEKSIKVENL